MAFSVSLIVYDSCETREYIEQKTSHYKYFLEDYENCIRKQLNLSIRIATGARKSVDLEILKTIIQTNSTFFRSREEADLTIQSSVYVLI